MSRGCARMLGATVALVPAQVWACPACAGNSGNGVARLILVGLMIAAPYVAASVVIRAIRKGEAAMSEDAKSQAVVELGER